ncbi:MAG: hypothetical protein ACKVS8_02915 [Phycisphaerales bacterium]
MRPAPSNLRSIAPVGVPAPPRGLYAGATAFTLLETALATVILAVGILALIEAQGSFTRLNDFSSNAATASYLAGELRERMRPLPRHDAVTGLYSSTSGGQPTLVGWGRETGETTPADLDDLDDYDGATFGTGGTFAGPIDATGRVLPELNNAGEALMTNGVQVNMRGWSQTVSVEKVDPRNFATVRGDGYAVAATGGTPAITVDQFPLRVTLVVSFTAPGATSAEEMARVVFIVPP